MHFERHSLGLSEVHHAEPQAGERNRQHVRDTSSETDTSHSPGRIEQVRHQPGGRAHESAWSKQILQYLIANPEVLEVLPRIR